MSYMFICWFVKPVCPRFNYVISVIMWNMIYTIQFNKSHMNCYSEQFPFFPHQKFHSALPSSRRLPSFGALPFSGSIWGHCSRWPLYRESLSDQPWNRPKPVEKTNPFSGQRRHDSCSTQTVLVHNPWGIRNLDYSFRRKPAAWRGEILPAVALFLIFKMMKDKRNVGTDWKGPTIRCC